VDKDILVDSGTALVQLLDQNGLKPRAAMWVYNSDTVAWRLWIVPDKSLKDKAEFYRKLAAVISQNRDKLPGFDIGYVEYKSADHPVVKGMRSFIQMDGLGSVQFSNNRMNGVFLPDGIVLRMAV
jgi:hypothetical protein